METKFLVILVVLNIAYILLGGLFFHLLESPHEEDSKQELSDYKQMFLANHTCISEETFDDMIRFVLAKYDEGLLPANNSKTNWDFGGSVFFASTVITTIGYGHISPVTVGGRVVVIFYALIGIPMCLVMLAGIGFRLANVAKRWDTRLNLGFNEKVGRVVRGLLLFCMGFSLFILAPAGIFWAVEDWTYDEAVYFSLITLTTIGFGDLVAGQALERHYEWWYLLFVGVWVFVGLAWCATAISNAQEVYQAFVHPEEKPEDMEALDLSSTSHSKLEEDSEEAQSTPAMVKKKSYNSTEKADLINNATVDESES